MTEQTQPTDAELLPLIEKHLGLKPRRDDTVIDPRTGRFHDAQRYYDFAADILTKWGTPAGAGEPMAWMSRLPSGSEVFARTKDFYPDAVPVYLAPQPTQPQAGAVPLKYARLHAISLDYSDSEDECTGFRDGWRAAEKHHGIKGADHA